MRILIVRCCILDTRMQTGAALSCKKKELRCFVDDV